MRGVDHDDVHTGIHQRLGSLEALFPLLVKEKLHDVRYAVRLGKKHGVLRTQLLAKVPPKAETLTVEIAEKGVDPAAFKEQLDAYVAKHKGKRLVAVVTASAKTRIGAVVAVLDQLSRAGLREIRFVARRKKG